MVSLVIRRLCRGDRPRLGRRDDVVIVVLCGLPFLLRLGRLRGRLRASPRGLVRPQRDFRSRSRTRIRLFGSATI